jgi:hypothetical protein
MYQKFIRRTLQVKKMPMPIVAGGLNIAYGDLCMICFIGLLISGIVLG